MSEGAAYYAFLAIVGGALALLTMGLAAIGYVLIRQHRKHRSDDP